MKSYLLQNPILIGKTVRKYKGSDILLLRVSLQINLLVEDMECWVYEKSLVFTAQVT